MNIVLTGMMGTGKTVVGKKLAQKLNMKYISTDEMIEKDAGMSVPKIFKRKGEPYFRDVETKAVKCVAMLDNFVIDTGGGVVQRSENMEELERNGPIICLTASPEAILKRTSKTNYRPLLNVDSPVREVKKLLKKRKKFYKRCNRMIDTSNKGIEEVVDEIIKFLSEREKR
ncbi:MAG: AAA family ATPase [Elusimicrobiota bacterium]|nr:AAA family ATPase [Elusimicrobiota bacterium]MDH5662122.1 AAA family ATPase [Elusimicrobiota bacterium]